MLEGARIVYKRPILLPPLAESEMETLHRDKRPRQSDPANEVLTQRGQHILMISVLQNGTRRCLYA